MDGIENIELSNIGQFGIIASIFKKHKIIEKIDKLLPKVSYNQKISHGEAVLALVLQGLGFGGNRLYQSQEFFSHVAVQKLFRPGLLPDHFSPSVLARTLDEIYKYGPPRFFFDCSLAVVMKKNLLKKFIHIDTTSFAVTGKKYKDDGSITLTHGYSKDHRMDLKQLVYLLVSSEDGIPLHAEAKSGNVSDNALFQDAMVKVEENPDFEDSGRFFVLDSSIYRKHFLSNNVIMSSWITRVPESVKVCREAVEKEYADAEWTKVDENYKYIEMEAEYGGKKQRWLVVRNRRSKYKELATFEKRLEKELENIKRSIKRLESRVFSEKKDANREFENLKRQHPNFSFTYRTPRKYRQYRGVKRKIRIGFEIKITPKRNEERIEKQRQKKGRFVLATDCLDAEKIGSGEILDAYRSRNKSVEGCFKFMKGKDLQLNQICLKKESRIEALMSILTLTLFTNNLAQLILREHLTAKDATLRTKSGKATQNPTFKRASQLLRHITLVTMRVKNKTKQCIQNVSKACETIIRAFGPEALEIYGLT